MTISSYPMTDEIRGKIRELAKDNELHFHQIAALVGVNHGRVSETLRGKHSKKVVVERELWNKIVALCEEYGYENLPTPAMYLKLEDK